MKNLQIAFFTVANILSVLTNISMLPNELYYWDMPARYKEKMYSVIINGSDPKTKMVIIGAILENLVSTSPPE